MTNKHTAGPWRVAFGSGKMVIADRVTAIADCIGEDAEANAALIASAPDLLAALERAQQDINWMLNNRAFLNPNAVEYIDAVIAKARGE